MINLTLSAKIDFKGEVTGTFSERTNYTQEINTNLTQVNKLKISKSLFEHINQDQCLTILLKDECVYTYSGSNKDILKLPDENQSENSKIRYFVNQYGKLSYLNPDVSILLFHLP